MITVVDASAVADLVAAEAHAGPALRERLLRDGVQLHAPELLDLEVLSTIRRRLARRELDSGQADTAVLVLRDLPVTRHRHFRLAGRIWALRENVTPYDAAYVALAELLDAPLVTLDRRLASAPLPHVRFETI